jgi:hypothetical protein
MFHLRGLRSAATRRCARRVRPAEPAPTRLDAEQYFALVDRGELRPDDRVELLEGVLGRWRHRVRRMRTRSHGSTGCSFR